MTKGPRPAKRVALILGIIQSPAEQDAVAEAARLAGMTTNEWVRDRIRKAAAKEIRKQATDHEMPLFL